jgi:signal transduction histidine kinase/CheY-like chemotaxis protein
MAETSMGAAPSDSAAMATAFQQLRGDALSLALPWVYAGGLLFILLPIHRDPLQTASQGLILILLAAAVWFLRRLSHTLAAWALVAGLYAIGWLLLAEGHVAPAVGMVTLASGLTTLVVGFTGSVATALIYTLLVVLAPRVASAVDLTAHWVALVQMWSIIWLLWLGSRPLLTTMEWFHTSYTQNLDLLRQARDNQLQLNQTLQDLADAHSQLTRLNQLAVSMRQLAEDARHTKEQFVANVSHELRTPLNIILGFIEMIMQAPETYGRHVPRALLADLSVVLRNGKHLSDLIDDVLDLSQIETGHMALTKERAAFANIVDAAVLAVQPLFESKRLYLRTDIAPDLPEIHCDKVRIRQVLLNLLSNAGRFTEIGGVQLRAWQEHGDLLVSVADTGPGIAHNDIEKVFQPFQQVDNSIRRRYGGSGLGLNISKAFVELHDGKMWMESTVGQGVTVYFSLPLSTPVPAFTGALRWISPYADYYPRTRPSLAPIPVNRARLVVVETGGAAQRLLTRYLTDVEMVHAGRMADAVAEATRVPTQAILVNTLAIGAQLQQLEATPELPEDTPVILCAVPGPQDSASLLGVSDYLIKPVDRERLLTTIHRVAPAGQSVLLVDDDPDALLMFRRMLASAEREYRVMRAENGRQALQVLAEQRPDLILLDLIMPGMDGFQFLMEKSRDPALRAIPVVVVSAQDPQGQPIVSRTVAVTHSSGISARQLLGLIEATVHLLSPQQAHLGVQYGEEVGSAHRLADEPARA